MANEPLKVIKVIADSELGKLVDEARRYKVGVAVVESVRETSGPATCSHEKLKGSGPLSGSELPVPSKVTVFPTDTVWSGPALARRLHYPEWIHSEQPP
jgi:hypothetical protein